MDSLIGIAHNNLMLFHNHEFSKEKYQAVKQFIHLKVWLVMLFHKL